jgi:CBS domain containing-hemolysin-like protein
MMEMRKQTVMKNCKEIKKVFMISSEERYSSDLKNKIRIKGFSKIPIY